MPRQPLPNLPDRYLVRMCEMFLEDVSAPKIAQWVNTEAQQEGRTLYISREQVYPLIREARKRGYFTVRPPAHVGLRQRLTDLYRVSETSELPITVVNALGPSALDQVAAEAAAVALRIIKTLEAHKQPIHIGLGAGFTTLKIVHHLTALLRAEPMLPPLVLHALSTGFRVDQPHIAPAAFFSLFDSLPFQIAYVGLFAPAVVLTPHYDAVKGTPGVVESFDAAGEIDLVLTSLASAADEHGALNQFLAVHAGDVEELRQAGWVGDVQYRPFSRHGPLSQEASIRAVTLFDLPELVTLAQTPHKYVIVVAGPCGQCGRTRADALYPMLTVPSLKVWTHLIVDLPTAHELVTLAL